MYDEYDTFFIV